MSSQNYYNSLLARLPLHATQSLHLIQNVVAWLVFNLSKFSYITPLLRSRHWLPGAVCIRFKTLTLPTKPKHTSIRYLSHLALHHVPFELLAQRLTIPQRTRKTCIKILEWTSPGCLNSWDTGCVQTKTKDFPCHQALDICMFSFHAVLTSSQQDFSSVVNLMVLPDLVNYHHDMFWDYNTLPQITYLQGSNTHVIVIVMFLCFSLKLYMRSKHNIHATLFWYHS